MKFSEQLNNYAEKYGFTSKELSEISGLSPATVSRYRSGERVPDIATEPFEKLCGAVTVLSKRSADGVIKKEDIMQAFSECSDVSSIDKNRLRNNFNTLVSVMNINISMLCRHTNYDASTVFRIRNGSRKPSDPMSFASGVAGYVSKEMQSDEDIRVLSELFGCDKDDLSDVQKRFDIIRSWLIEGKSDQKDHLSGFLSKINEFDLNEYIKAIKFDELKVPSLPFQLPTSKTYSGIKEMMDSELDFLKATVLSKSSESVIMYSDMPLGEMAKDAEFPKKWLFGMAMMLKKGLHLNQIHNIDRSFDDMMLGLEGWIPMYMTGQISPYYFKGVQNNVFSHLLKVSGAAALSGEAITGRQSRGRYYLTKSKDEVAYYRRLAEDMLKKAYPLMEIYRSENASVLNAFLLSNSTASGRRRQILSAPPLFTIGEETLDRLLEAQKIKDKDKKAIKSYMLEESDRMKFVLSSNTVVLEIPELSREEFEKYPLSLSLSGLFFEDDILYDYESYLEHLEQTKNFAENNPNCVIDLTSANAFRNLQIIIKEGEWAMVSKSKSPAIHFVIHHPKLRNAIENFVPPMVDE